MVFVASTKYVPAIWIAPYTGTAANTGTEAELTALRVIGSLVVKTMDEFTATPAALYTGVVLVTVGPVVSSVDEADVVNVLANGVMMLPARSRSPVIPTV